MEIIKEIKQRIKTTDEREALTGHSYVFKTNDGRTLCGVYQGISKHGALMFTAMYDGSEFSVMPKSIQWMYYAEIRVQDGSKPETGFGAVPAEG